MKIKMSTAYPPRLVKYLFSSKKERNSARASAMTPGFFGTFSPIMGLYYTGPGTDFLSERFVLSAIDPHDKTTPKQDLHAVTFHKGPGILQMTLYSTTEHGSTPMVIATNNHRYGSSTDITLPAPINGAQKIERLQYGSIASNSYSFILESQMFRWRQDKAKSPKVMRLVREATAPVADDESTTLIEKSGKSVRCRPDFASHTHVLIPNIYRPAGGRSDMDRGLGTESRR